jgi:hypothetical protein
MQRTSVAANYANRAAQKCHKRAEFPIIEKWGSIATRGTNVVGQLLLAGAIIHNAAKLE